MIEDVDRAIKENSQIREANLNDGTSVVDAITAMLEPVRPRFAAFATEDDEIRSENTGCSSPSRPGYAHRATAQRACWAVLLQETGKDGCDAGVRPPAPVPLSV